MKIDHLPLCLRLFVNFHFLLRLVYGIFYLAASPGEMSYIRVCVR